MAWATLNSQLYNLINNNKGSLNIQEVYNYPKLTFQGYPAASIFESDVPSDYETTTENLREYVFKLRIFHEVRKGGLEDSMETLRPVVDAVMDLIDEDALKTDASKVIGVAMPSNKTFIDIGAVPGFWGQLESEGIIFTEITVRMKISVDIET